MKKECKQKCKNSGFILTAFLCVAMGFAAGIMMPKYFDSVPKGHGTPVAVAILVGYVVVAFFASIILHEAGHLIFGLMTGYRFSSFRIGALMLVKTNGRMRLKLHSVQGTGGQCLLAPPDMKDGKMSYVLYFLGGVIANLFSASLFGILTYITRNYIYAASLFFVLTILNLTLALSNGIPISTATMDNDGKNAISLGKTPLALRALWIQLKINAETANGKRLSQMPNEWFIIPDNELDNALVSSIISFRTNRLMDMKCFEEAEELIVKYKNTPSLPGIYKKLLVLDEITVKAMRGAEYFEIANLFTKEIHVLMNAMKGFPAIIRTKYVFALLVENNPSGAARALEAFERIKKSYPYESDLEAEREIMLAAEEKNREIKTANEE